MNKITQLSQLDNNGCYSYADYLNWQLEGAFELIKGKIQLMSPAPTARHQDVSRNLLLIIGNYLHKKSCKVFHAPFDVRLYDRKKSISANKEIFTVIQPDLCVICDKEKIDIQGCLGAPDWIIEILSKSNSKKEMHTKYALYEESGVKEYWLVYPYEQAVYGFVFDDDLERYGLHAMYSGEDIAIPFTFPELQIDLQEVFAD